MIELPGYFQVELFGHVRHYAYVTEVELFGAKFAHLDVLEWDDSSQSLVVKREAVIGPAAIYRLAAATLEELTTLLRPHNYRALDTRSCSCCGEPDGENDIVILDSGLCGPCQLAQRMEEARVQNDAHCTACSVCGHEDGREGIRLESSGLCPTCDNQAFLDANPPTPEYVAANPPDEYDPFAD